MEGTGENEKYVPLIINLDENSLGFTDLESYKDNKIENLVFKEPYYLVHYEPLLISERIKKYKHYGHSKIVSNDTIRNLNNFLLLTLW